MEQRADLNGRQVKCLIAWKGTSGCGATSTGFLQSCDVALPKAVLTSARHVMDEEARMAASKPSVAVYFAVIESIEKKLGATKLNAEGER
jgi:hypothetical protein